MPSLFFKDFAFNFQFYGVTGIIYIQQENFAVDTTAKISWPVAGKLQEGCWRLAHLAPVKRSAESGIGRHWGPGRGDAP